MANQPQGLNGLNPLSYMGVNPGTPPNLKTYNRAPLTTDSHNFLIGSIWLFPQATTPATALVWMLTALVGGQATWQQIVFNAANEFVTDDGTAFPVGGVLNVLGMGGIQTIGGGNTIVIETDGTLLDEVVTDAGTAIPVGGVLNVLGGANINTAGAGDTVTINLNTSINQPATTADGLDGMYSLAGNRFMYAYGPTNTFLGTLAGNLTLTPADAFNDVGIGGGSLASLTTGANNASLGTSSGAALTTGAGNLFAGTSAASSLLTGSNNVILGTNAGFDYTGAESSNIIISSIGVTGESNTIRIGTQGTGVGQQAAAYMAGVYDTSPGSPNQVALVGSTGKLGSSTGTDGQVLIGATGGSPAWANITAGANVTVVNGANSITISSTTTPVEMVAFLAYLSTDVVNATGDGTVYQVAYDTLAFNVGGGWSLGTNTFTAPVTGYYQFTANAIINNLSSAMVGLATGIATLASTIQGVRFQDYSGTPGTQTNQTLSLGGATGFYMNAGETMYLNIQVAGGTKTATVHGTDATMTNMVTYISGLLVAS